MMSFAEAFTKIENDARDSTQKRPSIFMGGFAEIKERSAARELILYGAGSGGYSMVEWMNNLGIPFHGVCDGNRGGQSFNKLTSKILTPHELIEKHSDAVVVITSMKFEREISENLRQMGFPNERIIPVPEFPSYPSPAISVDEFRQDYYGGYEEAYNLLTDKLSQDVLIGRVRAYILGDAIPRSSDSQQYFERGVVSLQQDEVFVDGGGYSGDTFTAFIHECESARVYYMQIYSFEPCAAPDDEIVRVAARYANVEVIPKGLWCCDAELPFSMPAMKSAASVDFNSDSSKATTLQVTSLDSFFKNKPVKDWPTFIKMDIEGAEQEALNGAREILRTKHPKLALCVYHKPDDVYQLIRIARECNPDYRFALRQCISGYCETVLYAV